MTNEEITRLRTYVRHYYDAVSTPDEERELRRMLLDPTLPGEFVADREMLRHVDAFLPPEGFEERMAARIDSLARAERMAEAEARARRRRTRLLRWSAAASVAVVVSLGIGFAFGRTQKPAGSDLTPEQTYAEVSKVLSLMAGTIDKGYEEAYKAETVTENATAQALAALSILSTDETN